jgi:hypothetical protein
LKRAWMAAVAVALAPVAGPADATASSLVYLKGGDVYLSAPDGSSAKRLTSGGGYESPSQADGGMIVAIKPGQENGVTVRRIHRMDRAGRPLGPPVATGPTNSATYSGPLSAEVAPDGSLLAYHFLSGVFGNPQTAFAPVDRDSSAAENGGAGGHVNPSWIDARRVVIFGLTTLPNVSIDSPAGAGTGQSQGWFDDADAKLASGEVDRPLDRFAAVRDDGTELRIYEMSQPPPAAPVVRCAIHAPALAHPSWSPDGRQLAWEEPDGIHVAELPTLENFCKEFPASLAIPGGADPDWGPAEAPACVVPQLRGRTAKKARRKLLAAGCKVGSVTRRRASAAKRGRVIKQSPAPGSAETLWTRVALTIGK